MNKSQHCAIINPIAVTTKGGRLACASPVQTTLICGEAQVCDCSDVWLLWSVMSLICYCFVEWLLRCVGKGVFCRQDNTSFASISKSTVVKPESSCIYQLQSSRIETRGENPRSGQSPTELWKGGRKWRKNRRICIQAKEKQNFANIFSF